jgi:hypothetical protein
MKTGSHEVTGSKVVPELNCSKKMRTSIVIATTTLTIILTSVLTPLPSKWRYSVSSCISLSPMTLTPNSFAFSSFEPASVPATT